MITEARGAGRPAAAWILLYAAWLAVLLTHMGPWLNPGSWLPPGWLAAAGASLRPVAAGAVAGAVARLGAVVLVAAAVPVVLGGAGDPVARWLWCAGGATRVAIALGTGLWALSAAVRALGFCGLLFSPLLAVLVVAPLGFALARRLPARAVRDLPPLSRTPLVVLGVLLIPMLLFAALPLYAADVSSYHLGSGDEFLRAHRMFAHPWDWNWHLGLATEDALLPFYSLGGLGAAKAAQFGLVPALLAVTAAAAARCAGPSVAWWTAALVAGCGLLPATLLSGKTDLGSILGVAAATAVLLDAGARGSAGRWAAIGLIAGWAFTAKYNAGFAAVGLAAGALAWRGLPALRGLFPFIAAIGVATAPLLVSNWLWLGAPLYPYGVGPGAGLLWTPELGQSVARSSNILLGIDDLRPSALGSYFLNFGIPDFGAAALGLLLPVGLLRRGGDPGLLRFLRTFLAVAYGGLLVFNQYPRYLGFLLPAAGVMAARAWPGPGMLMLRAGLVAVLVAGTAAQAVRQAGHMEPAAAGYVVGSRTADDVAGPVGAPAASLGRWLDAHLGPRDRVLVGWNQRLLGVRARQFSSTIWAPSPFWHWSRAARTGAGLAKLYRQHGITHVVHNGIRARWALVSWDPGPAWTDRQLAVSREFSSRWLTLVYRPERTSFEGGAFHVWRVDRAPHSPRLPLIALPGTEGLARPVNDALLNGALPQDLKGALVGARALAGRIGPVLDSQDWVAWALAASGRWNEALPFYERERAAGYLNERSEAWHIAALNALGREAEAREVEAAALARSGTPEALLRHPLLEWIFPVPAVPGGPGGPGGPAGR